MDDTKQDSFDAFITNWNAMAGTPEQQGHVLKCPVLMDDTKNKIIVEFLEFHAPDEVEAFQKNVNDSVFFHQRASEGWKPSIFWAIQRADEIIAGYFTHLIKKTPNCCCPLMQAFLKLPCSNFQE